MNINETTFLPGLNNQLDFFLNHINVKNKSVLIIGSNSENIARSIFEQNPAEVFVIIDDQESLVKSKFLLSEFPEISVRFMEYQNTDFKKEKFDIVYSQASISRNDRNKIVKEIKKILKPDGIFCVGEIISLEEEAPQFVIDVWEQSDVSPLNKYEINNYYEERNFKILQQKNLTATLKDFYSLSKSMLKEKIEEIPEKEKSYYKKLLNMISHESNVYLKHGGNEYIGFKTLIMQKEPE